MFIFAALIILACGVYVLMVMSLPKDRGSRIRQQMAGTSLFAVGLVGFLGSLMY